jgi:hypothetical protein
VLQKIFNYIGLIAIIAVFILLYCLWNDRSGSDRISELNQQYREQIKSANIRIGELETGKQADQRTIDNFTANQRKSEATIKRLTELVGQSRNSIGAIETGDQQDRTDLQRLRQIIEKDGAGK